MTPTCSYSYNKETQNESAKVMNASATPAESETHTFSEKHTFESSFLPGTCHVFRVTCIIANRTK